MSKTFVIVIDTQVDFVMEKTKLPVEGAEKIIAPGIHYLTALDPATCEGVLFTFDTHFESQFIGSPENIGDPGNGVPGFPIHCEKGTPGWENVFNPRLINDAIPVYKLEKNVFNMWENDQVLIEPVNSEERLRTQDRDVFFDELKGQGIETVVVFGVAADFCVKWAIEGLLERGFRVEVPAHLAAGILRDIEQTVVEDFEGCVLIV